MTSALAHREVEEVLSGERRWCLIHADNRDVLPTLPDKSVAHVITDPPYEAEAHTKARRALKDSTQRRGTLNTGKVRRIDQPLDIRFGAISPCERHRVAQLLGALTARWVVVFCQIEAIALWRTDLVGAGLEWVRGGVWRKPDGAPQFTGDRPGQGFESIAISHPPGRKRWNGGGKHAVWSHALGHGHGNGLRNDHPTQKPITLMVELVADFTDPDEVVLDPFAGSGTTGVACLRLGRRFIGIEKDEAFAKTARERLEAESQGLTLRAARAGQMPLFHNPGGAT